jgi:hypothetical protein
MITCSLKQRPAARRPFRAFCYFILLTLAAIAASAAPAPEFPRLLGMNIGRKHYDDPAYQAQLARLDVVILGFYAGWNPRHEADPIGSVLRNLKRLNPRLKIGQYTILNETYDDPRSKPNAEVHAAVVQNDWWLRNAAGQKVQWTKEYSTWEINISPWAPADAEGLRYPEWRAAWDYRTFFAPHPEFDLWYCDNVMVNSRVRADWDRDGTDDDPKSPRYATVFRESHARHWQAIRKLKPGVVIMGNADNDLSSPEYRKKLDASFIEGWMGKSWSPETRRGWSAALKLYRDTLANLPDGAIVGVNVWGAPDDYRFFRYAFASCLLDDGYFAFTDKTKGYSSVTWFDEFDVALGRATTPPPAAAWRDGVWRRDFEKGVALVNPTDAAVVVELEPGFSRIRGQQAPTVNDGTAAEAVTLAPKDGIILRRTASAQR